VKISQKVLGGCYFFDSHCSCPRSHTWPLFCVISPIEGHSRHQFRYQWKARMWFYQLTRKFATAMHCNLRPPDSAPVVLRFKYDAHTKTYPLPFYCWHFSLRVTLTFLVNKDDHLILWSRTFIVSAVMWANCSAPANSSEIEQRAAEW